MNKTLPILFLSIFFLCSSTYGFELNLPENLSLSLGPIIGVQPEYSGSNDENLIILPYFDAAYTVRSLTFSASISDLGITYTNEGTGLFLTAGAGLGSSRDRKDSEDLEDTANIQNLVSYFMETGYSNGLLGMTYSMAYFPLKMKYQGDVPNETKDGLLYTIAGTAGYCFLPNLIFITELGCSYMNADYAEAYHGVKYQTTSLEEYKPGAGFQALYCEPTLTFMATDSIGINLIGRYERLLGEAADSPLTKSKNQITAYLYLSYTF